MSRGLVNKSTGERIPSAPGYIVDKVGDLSALHTTAKDKAVSAINEVADAVSAVETALADKTDTDMVAADFNAGTSYTAGNYCVQDGKLYRFKNNHSGAWSASDVEEVKIAGELATLKSGLSNNIFKSGDIISATTSDDAISTYGFIQHMTQVYVMIPVNKPISATSFTVTDMESFFVRYDGHLVDALANITSIGNQTILSNGCLQFAVNFNTGTFSGIEHMPAIITINAKITFV